MLEYFNNITEELNEYLLPQYNYKSHSFYTYIGQWKQDNPYTWCIRFPGATRGHIKVDDNMIITEINLYDSAFQDGIGCYKREAEQALTKHIGTKLILNKEGIYYMQNLNGDLKIKMHEAIEGAKDVVECYLNDEFTKDEFENIIAEIKQKYDKICDEN